MSVLTDFYSGVGTDCEGRTLEEILAYSYKKLEFGHTYIQWMFPLREPSNFNPDAPILTDEDIALWRANPLMQENLFRAFTVFLDFLGLEVVAGKDDNPADQDAFTVQKAPHFEDECRVLFKRANHNWLRITRILTCLKTIGAPMLVNAANEFYECLRKLHEEEGLVSDHSFNYWREAHALLC